MAFNAKNLTYDKSEPAFLQRLKAGYASQDGRNNVQHARSGKSRLKMGDGDDDDGPVIVDESGEVVEKKVYEGMLKGDLGIEEGEKREGVETNIKSGKDESGRAQEEGQDDDREKQKVAGVGATKKRKAVKVVDTDEAINGEVDDQSVKDSSANVKGKNEKHVTSEKSKKKPKKIKLSFDDPE